MAEALAIITLPGLGNETFQFLHSRIFFNDKVSLDDASQDYGQIDLLGPGVSKFLRDMGVEQFPENDAIQTIKITEIPTRVLMQKWIGYRLVFQKEDTVHMLTELKNRGATSLSPESYEVLRIESGLPVARHELTEDYTPLETGFQWAISTGKGCYTGQEVIARQVNFDKVTRQLVGLRMSELPDQGDTIHPINSDQPVGKITSSTMSPRFGPIALGIVKRPHNQPGNELHAGDREGNILATITPLPFQ